MIPLAKETIPLRHRRLLGRDGSQSLPISVMEGNSCRWYLIRTKPRQESLVEQRVQDLNLRVFLPWLRSRRRIGSRYQWVLVPLFPGYIFCHLDLNQLEKTIQFTPGVKDFVRFGNSIPDIREGIIQALQDRCPDGIAQMQPHIYRLGEAIIIREGPFSGLEAIFEREMEGSSRVAVLLELLGRQTRLVLSSEMIGPA